MEFTTGETTGPGAIAGVTEGPLPRPTSSHTPTPATPLPGIPDPVGVPKGTNNAYQNEYTNSFIQLPLCNINIKVLYSLSWS